VPNLVTFFLASQGISLSLLGPLFPCGRDLSGWEIAQGPGVTVIHSQLMSYNNLGFSPPLLLWHHYPQEAKRIAPPVICQVPYHLVYYLPLVWCSKFQISHINDGHLVASLCISHLNGGPSAHCTRHFNLLTPKFYI